MGRRCQCERLLEMLENDWRLKIVGRETAMVWLELTRFIYRFGEDLVLRVDTQLGSPIGSIAELAFALRIDESELSNHLETLFERRLLVKAPCGGVAMPPELGLTARQKAARLNGSKGGRPRKDGQPSGQRSLLLPIPSNPLRKPAITQKETHLSDVTTTTTDSADSDSVSGRKAALPPTLSLGDELASLAGHRKSPHARDLALVQGWVDAGATRDLLMGVFQSVLAREKCPPLPALSYFDGPVRDALAVNRGARAEPIEAVARVQNLVTEEDVALRKRLVAVSAMRGRHSSSPLAPTWDAFKAVAARGEGPAAVAVAWLEVLERWERNGFPGRTPPSFAAYVTRPLDSDGYRSTAEKMAFG